MGITLGLIGAGGSILTIPVLIYILHIDIITATSLSLFIVGVTSLAGSIKAYTDNLVNLRIVFLFGIPSLLTAFVTHKWLIPLLPDHFFRIGNIALSKELFLLLFFAVIMIIVAIRMIRMYEPVPDQQKNNYLKAILFGLLTGIVTGLIGAGGGFLVIPALVLLLGLPMKNAIGTSLAIVTINTLVTFTGSLSHTIIDWNMLLIFSACSIGGVFAGLALSKKIPGEKLKPFFGWFILLMGFYIIVRELVL